MNKPLAFFGIGMSVFFAGAGIAMIAFPPPMFANSSMGLRIAFGVMLFLYAGFRFSRALKALKDENQGGRREGEQ